MHKALDQLKIFDQLKSGILNIDPVAFCEQNLTLDGSPFRINGNGYKPYADIYRKIGTTCLNVDRKSKPIVLVKGRQVGATTMAAAIELYFMASGMFGRNGKPPIRVMHAFPTLVHVHLYAKTKFNTMMKTSKSVGMKNNRNISVIESKLDKDSQTSDSLQYKQFEGGNFVRIESTGLDADRLRGSTVDVILYDECQDIPSVAIANSNKSLTTAKYGRPGKGVQVYFGTPKSKSSKYYEMWMDSTQNYYYLGCEKCKKYFPLYTPGSDAWEKIWIYGFIVKCTECGHEQDKRIAAENGKWISNKNEDDCGYVGYHINQFYNPTFTREEIDSEKPENSIINTERAYQNEVLGEFFAGDSGPISKEEIIEMCGDSSRCMRASIPGNEGAMVFAGFDWGKRNDERANSNSESKSGGKSYSTCVILREDGPGRLLIDYASIIKKNDNQYKREFIHEVMRKYSVIQAVGDYGYAHELTEDIHREYKDRFLGCELVGGLANKPRFDSDSFPHLIRANREHYIEEVFSIMKRGMIRFPLGGVRDSKLVPNSGFDRISWLIEHCASMEEKITTNIVNEVVKRYVKGNTPNDGMMALVNAYLAYKFHVTNGFKDNKKGVFEKANNEKVLAIIGHCPGMR
jgi:hypothetical protein